jgi:demethylmenaquinone methyltransferase/2-methoxy-6-polyprenyl-1,4-benzoquinol methylase
VRWVCTDALSLPFPAESFDSVVSGYLLRNVSDITRAWREQLRVLKPGGRVVCLDTTPPRKGLLHLPVRLYLRWGIPLIGRIIAGDSEAYTYLPESTRQFLTAEALAQSMQEAGFREVGFKRLMLGTMAIHWGRR